MSESYWWCPTCRGEVDGAHVTFEEFHETCGTPVVSLTLDDRPLTERIAELEQQLALVKPGAS